MDETIDSALLEAGVEATLDGTGDPSPALHNSAILYAQIAGTIATLLFSVQCVPPFFNQHLAFNFFHLIFILRQLSSA
jgi:hypothetical protein